MIKKLFLNIDYIYSPVQEHFIFKRYISLVCDNGLWNYQNKSQ